MITKYLLIVGPVHNDDVMEIIRRIDGLAETRVTTYEAKKTKRVYRKTGIRRTTITPGLKTQMIEMRSQNVPIEKIMEVCNVSKVSVERHAPLPQQKVIKL